MPLEFATALLVRDASDGSPASQIRVREVVAAWAEVPAAVDEDVERVAGRGGGKVDATTEALPDGRSRWRLWHRIADGEDANVEWSTNVSAVFETDGTSIAVELRRDSRERRLRPLTSRPAVPRVVRDLLQADDVESLDGPIRIDARYRLIEQRDVHGFVDLTLLADDRRLPVIGIAPRPDTPLVRDAGRLSRRLAGFAHVAVLRGPALRALGEELDELSLAQRCVRIWWPGMELDDAPTAHPSFEGGELDDRLEALMIDVAREQWHEPPRMRRFSQGLRLERDRSGQEAAGRVAEQLRHLREQSEAARATVDHQADSAVLETMEIDLEGVREQLSRAEQERDYNQAQWLEAQEARESLERANFAMNGRIEALLAQRDISPTAQPQSEEERFRADVLEAWTTKQSDDDRQRHPLAVFRLHPEFLPSIEAAGASRSKVVETVMLVACGRAVAVAGREVHPLRVGAGATEPQRRRTSDEASAWRCAIQRGAPSARRLHWWKLDGGEIEFANVVKHDDMRIPN